MQTTLKYTKLNKQQKYNPNNIKAIILTKYLANYEFGSNLGSTIIKSTHMDLI